MGSSMSSPEALPEAFSDACRRLISKTKAMSSLLGDWYALFMCCAIRPGVYHLQLYAARMASFVRGMVHWGMARSEPLERHIHQQAAMPASFAFWEK